MQRLLREMVERGCQACAMEVSSHALALHRVLDLRFAAAIFTNLTRDHLDFHGDMQQYFAAKRRLFEMLPASAPAIVNIDDPRGLELAASAAAGRHLRDRSTGRRPRRRDRARHAGGPGVPGRDAARHPRHPVAARRAGRTSTTSSAVVGDRPSRWTCRTPAIEQGIAALERVPGRFQIVSTGADDVRVVVDYAHTDDALKNLLETGRALAAGRVITVFGCGGDRDRAKRPLMGAVAARLSDVDRPDLRQSALRGSDAHHRGHHAGPGADARARRAAARRPGRSRRCWIGMRAIEQAVRTASPGDLVLIAGKGHEKYQIVGDSHPAVRRRRGRARGAGTAPRGIEGVTTIVGAVVMTAATGRARRPAAGSLPATRRRVFDEVSIDSRTWRPAAGCSSRCAARASTATRSSTRRAARARPACWCRWRPPTPAIGRGRRRARHAGRAAGPGAGACAGASGARVVAITGSAGKTTTKEMTADLLATRYQRVPQSREPEQSHRAAALADRVASRPRLAVVELGMNHAGEIRTLVAIAQPEVRVWTNVGDAHSVSSASREAVAAAKAEILEQARRRDAGRRQRRRSARHGARPDGSPGAGSRSARSAGADVRADGRRRPRVRRYGRPT